jgi:carbonic anhydrase
MMRRTLIASSFLVATFSPARAEAPPAHAAAAVPAPAVAAVVAPAPAVDADEALVTLKEGNARFIAGESTFPNLDQDRRCFTTDGGQHPYVSVLSCADSRVPPELIFDAGIGDLFVVRVAGNVADTDEIGTLEYGAGHLGTPLIVVLGHTKCGAVTAVVNNASVHGSIPKLVDNIAPAVAEARAKFGGVTEARFVQYAIRANVFQSVKDVLSRSEEIRGLVSEGKVQIVGAVYDIHNGTIEWLGEHPQQTALLGAPAQPVDHEADAHAQVTTDSHAEAEPAHADPTKPEAAAPAHAEPHGEPHAVPAAKKADAHPMPAVKDAHGASHGASHDTSHATPPAATPKSAGHGAHDGNDAADAETAGHDTSEHPSLVEKHGLLVPGVFLMAGSVLSGTIVFVLKHKPTAAPATHEPAAHDKSADAAPAH